MESLSFYLVTDTHYFEPSLGASGKAYDEYMQSEQMCMAENAAVAKATFDAIIADPSVNILLIPGDLTKNGEKESHRGFIKELERLKNAGKRVYVTTALHDFNDVSRGYRNDGIVTVEGTKREELYDLYYGYGFKDALAFDKLTMSYCAKIGEGVRLLAINCDGEQGDRSGSMSERLLGWIKEQADAAKRDGCFLFAMTHYPVIPSVPVFELVGDAHIDDWRRVASFLADNGVPLIFTGHMHIQSVNEYISEQNNRLIDVCTSALPGSPAKYRKVEIKENGDIVIGSFDVPPFDWDMKGLTNRRYFDAQFERMVAHTLAGAFGDKGIKAVIGKHVRKMTIGGLGRLLFIRVPKPLSQKTISDFAGEVFVAILAGDMPHTAGTPAGDVFIKALKRLRPLLKIVGPKIIKDKRMPALEEMLLNTVGKAGRFKDNNTVIKKEDLA